jgi:outer membrane protein OmpA-like peptidoglycan-associated protein
MVKKDLGILILILCLGLILIGCPKKTMVREEPSVKKEEGMAKRETERTKEIKTKEEQGWKEFGKSLVAKKELGIEGEVFENKLLKKIHFDFDKYNIRPGEQRFSSKMWPC